jgi:hypothetical protein
MLADKDDVGACQLEKSISLAFASNRGNRILAFKAVRRVGNYLELGIGPAEVDLLVSIWMWCEVMKKRGGLKRVIDWTGYISSWKRQLYKASENCLKLELLALKPVQRGTRIVITEKGKQVLLAYDKMLEQTRLEELAKGLNRTNHVLA